MVQGISCKGFRTNLVYHSVLIPVLSLFNPLNDCSVFKLKISINQLKNYKFNLFNIFWLIKKCVLPDSVMIFVFFQDYDVNKDLIVK